MKMKIALLMAERENNMTVAVLAVQGAFIEHEMMLNQIGVECFEIRKKTDLKRSFDGLILPGEKHCTGKIIKRIGFV